jgi:glycosyltransferase involved in cell wall biosynthesis
VSEPGGRRRVLWLVKGLGPGGAERLLVEQAAAGDHTRFDYECAYLLDWKQHLVPALEARGVATHGLGVARELDPRWITRLHRLLRDGRYDVVHAHSPVPASVARVLIRTLPRARRPAFVYTEHNRWQSHNELTRTANRLTFGLDDADFAVSDDVRDSVDARHRASVEVLVHGIDVAAVRAHLAHRLATRAELGVGANECLAVTVANLRTTKNYPGLIAAARITTERGVPVRFAAAGQGPLEAEIRAEHQASGLGDRFALLGYRDDATRLIAAADLYVLASHHEGLPVTVMEALALGVPVIAPAVGGLREAVTDGESGLLVTPDDPVALADAIRRVAGDGGLRRRLSMGAQRAGDHYSSTHAVERIEAAYREVTGS